MLLLKLVMQERIQQEVLDVLLVEGISVECMFDESNGQLRITSLKMYMSYTDN